MFYVPYLVTTSWFVLPFFFSVFSFVFFFKQKTAYEMRISDWSSDVCSSDLSIFLVDATSTGLERSDFRTIDGGYASHIILNEEIGRASCRERVCQYV